MILSDLEQAIRSCNVEEVKRLIEDENRDVNQNFRHETDAGDILFETPLSISLENIKSENDDWFTISQWLLDHKNIDVNAECKTAWTPFPTALLGHVCGTNMTENCSTIFKEIC